MVTMYKKEKKKKKKGVCVCEGCYCNVISIIDAIIDTTYLNGIDNT